MEVDNNDDTLIDVAISIEYALGAPVVIRNLDKEQACKRSSYIDSKCKRWTPESKPNENVLVDVIIPRYLVREKGGRENDLGWLELLAKILFGQERGLLQGTDALRMWRVLAFLDARELLEEANTAIQRAISFWDRNAGVAPSARNVLHAYVLYLATDEETTTIMPPDPSEHVFGRRGLWTGGDCDHGPCSEESLCAERWLRLGKFAVFSREIEKAATELFGSPTEGRPEFATDEMLSYAVTRALNDFQACASAIDRLLRKPFSLSACNPHALSFSRHLRVSTGVHAGSPCLSDSIDSFKRALHRDFPVTARRVLLEDDWLARVSGVVLAGGSVLSAMQADHLRACHRDSDLDMWIIGEDEDERRGALVATVERVFECFPASRATINGSVITIVPEAGVSPERNERIQIIYTDKETARHIIHGFDLGYVCAFFDGATVEATWDCLASIVSRTTQVTRAYGPLKIARIEKARAKGFEYQPTEGREEEIDHGGDASHHPYNDNNGAGGGKRRRVQAECGTADEVLSAFLFRPLSDRAVRTHPSSRHPVVFFNNKGAKSIRIPPLRLPFHPRCRAGCQPSIEGMCCHGTCAMNKSVLSLQLERHSSDRRRRAASEKIAAVIEKEERALRTEIEEHRAIRKNAWHGIITKKTVQKNEDSVEYEDIRVRVEPGTSPIDHESGQPILPQLIPPGHYVEASVTMDRVCEVNAPYMVVPRLLASSVDVYPPTLWAVVDSISDAVCLVHSALQRKYMGQQ